MNTHQKPYITKSDFLKYQCCPSYFWLSKYKPELIPLDEDEAIEARKEQGDEVERCARTLYPEASLVTTYGLDARKDTENLVASGATSIFQATVVTDDGLLAMADLIVFDSANNCWDIYEVKSTKKIKSKHTNDVAFQRVAFEHAGYAIGRTYIIHMRTGYMRGSVINANELLVISDVSDKVGSILGDIEGQIKDASIVMEEKEEPTRCSCRLKSASGHCPTFQHFNPDIPTYSVFNIKNIGKSPKKLAQLIDEEIFKIEDVPEDFPLTDKQKNQVRVEKSQQPYIDLAGIKKLLGEIEYPIYFLDYETISTAMPMFEGCQSYQQIPFQYSLHIMETTDGELLQYEYLATDMIESPATKLLEMLQSHIGEKGSVVVWHKSFEASRNREMAATYPKYGEFLNSINERIFDLEDFFSRQLFIHPRFNGRSSIKVVLPVLVPELSYKGLDIQNGMIAPIRWYDAVNGNNSQVQATMTFSSLREYCGLDTLAMVRIYDYIKALN